MLIKCKNPFSDECEGMYEKNKRSKCMTCYRAYQRDYYKKHRDRINNQNLAHYHKRAALKRKREETEMEKALKFYREYKGEHMDSLQIAV